MSGLPGAFFFACVGFFVCLAWCVLMAALIIGWAFRARHGLVDAVWWVRARLAIRNRPAWIPAAPAPLAPWMPRQKARLTDEHIKTQLRALGAEIEAEGGDKLAAALAFLASNNHADH